MQDTQRSAEPVLAPELSIDTAPSTEGRLARLRTATREVLSERALPLMQRVARDHVGGESLDDAMAVAHRLAREGLSSTLGIWNAPSDTIEQVAAAYRAAIGRLARSGIDGYVSFKPPALRFDPQIAAKLAAKARMRAIRIHADSHGVDTADASYAMLEAMGGHAPGDHLGTTLPGRWSRSIADADWAIQRGIAVRVVKGQWADPADPKRDARTGFLEVIERLAGRARFVAVASHDLALTKEAISKLRASHTSCELELLFGLPMGRSLGWAKEHGVPVRVYIPYGKGYLPHALAQLRRNPRFIGWILKDVIKAMPSKIFR